MLSRAAVMALTLSLIVTSRGLTQTEFGGFAEYDNITYFGAHEEHGALGRNQAILQAELRHAAGLKAELFGAVEFRFDQADLSRSRVLLDEAILDLFLGNFDVRIGKQFFAWGRADGINPTDHLGVQDYSDLLDSERVAIVAAQATYYSGAWSADAVLVPWLTTSTLPDENSRWVPSIPPTIPNPGFPDQGSPTLDTNLTTAEPVYPENGLASAQYALRLSGSRGGWDFSLSWFDGVNHLPSVNTSVDIDSTFTTAEILVEMQYNRRRAIGVDFATAFGRYGVHGEAAYYITGDKDGTDPLVDDPYLLYTVGVDRTFSNVIGQRELFVLLEWVQEIPGESATRTPIIDLNHVFRRTIFAHVDLGLGRYTSFGLEGALNVGPGDWWLQPSFEWLVTDGLQLLASMDLLGGAADTFFGSFDGNQRVQVRLRYSFDW